MCSRIRRPAPAGGAADETGLAVLAQVVPACLLGRVVDEVGVREQRRRKLPAVLMLALSVAMHLEPDVGLDTVVRRLRRDRRRRESEAAVPATSGAICQARRRLGARPVVALFHHVARPLATAATPGAFRFGLRLMAVDGTVEDVPDSPANAQAFGRGRNQHQPTAFPQVRGVYLAECGTHAIIDAGFWPISVGEPRGARRLLRSVTPEMLLIWDRGLHSFTLATAVQARHAHFLGRVPASAHFAPDTWLPDGSALAWWTPPDRGGQRSAPPRRVRLISYTLHDPERPGYLQPHRLVTSLLDPTLAPARDLAETFHDRWEIELTINELATAQRRRRPLRRRTPIGVLQELYGLLVAHYAIRATMHAAAQPVGLDPRCLSFTHATRLIIETLPDFHGVAPTTQARLSARLLAELRRYRLPPRRLRSNPRVGKRRRSRYPPKRPHHHPAALTTTFRAAVILI